MIDALFVLSTIIVGRTIFEWLIQTLYWLIMPRSNRVYKIKTKKNYPTIQSHNQCECSLAF